MAATEPDKFVLADSRERIGLFRGVCLKPNRQEALRTVHSVAIAEEGDDVLEHAVVQLAQRAGRWVFCTDGARGILLGSPQDRVKRPNEDPRLSRCLVPSTSLAPATAPVPRSSAPWPAERASRAAAAFGNLVASITIQQLGTTGTATPLQVRQRWREVSAEQR